MKNPGIVLPSTYNQQGHVRARTNRMDPYPTEATIRDHARKAQHRLERYRDVFFMDYIWGAAETWRERLPNIEMSVFQEELIARGLKERTNEEDAMPASVQFPIMYVVVLAGECLEEIDKANESVVTWDLVVSRSYLVPISNTDLLPVSQREVGEDEGGRAGGEAVPEGRGPTGGELRQSPCRDQGVEGEAAS